jgi:hypothetical protein
VDPELFSTDPDSTFKVIPDPALFNQDKFFSVHNGTA